MAPSSPLCYRKLAACSSTHAAAAQDTGTHCRCTPGLEAPPCPPPSLCVAPSPALSHATRVAPSYQETAHARRRAVPMRLPDRMTARQQQRRQPAGTTTAPAAVRPAAGPVTPPGRRGTQQARMGASTGCSVRLPAHEKHKPAPSSTPGRVGGAQDHAAPRLLPLTGAATAIPHPIAKAAQPQRPATTPAPVVCWSRCTCTVTVQSLAAPTAQQKSSGCCV